MEINNSHPVIYLRGIQYSEIESILQFIYLGEAKFYEERMNEFLSVSKSLEIQELSKDVEIDQPQLDSSNQNKEFVTEELDNVDHNDFTEEDHESTLESDEIKVISREITKVGSKFQCPQCDKLFYNCSNVHAHIRSVHEGVKYACNQCDYQASYQHYLTTHIQSKHEGVKYVCNQCDQQFTTQSNLSKHVKQKHL